MWKNSLRCGDVDALSGLSRAVARRLLLQLAYSPQNSISASTGVSRCCSLPRSGGVCVFHTVVQCVD